MLVALVFAVLLLPTQTTAAAGSQYQPRQAFTIIALPDTQNYSKSYPQTFTAQTQWM